MHHAFSGLSVTLAACGKEKTLSGAELERLVSVPNLRFRLIELLFSSGGAPPSAPCPVPLPDPAPSPVPAFALPQPVHEEAGGRGVMELPGNLRTQTLGRDTSVRVGGGGGAGGGGDACGQRVDERERLANHVAERLGDAKKSLRFYRLVCATLDATTVRDALIRALDVDPSEVRRSRAALFTSIVHPLMAEKLRLRHGLPLS